jgi:hypothetical protein
LLIEGRRRYRIADGDAGSHDDKFVLQYCRVEIHGSARRHGVGDDDMLHAIEHSMRVDDVGEDPDRWLVIGPDRAGNLLEVVVLITTEGDELIIHAMRLRAIYRKLLDP